MSQVSSTAGSDLEALYRARFSDRERQNKEKIWEVLCRGYFQRWIPAGSTVLELACGYGEFIRNIQAARKIAIDLNPESRRVLGPEVEFHLASADQRTPLADNSVDVVFSSNFFEHLESKPQLDRILAEAFRVLKPGGRYLSLQPNLKFVKEAYWDFYDHTLPLTHLSAREAFLRQGYEIERLVDRFLPYTTKSRLPQAPWLVRLYLSAPWMWPLLGKQFFLVARKP